MPKLLPEYGGNRYECRDMHDDIESESFLTDAEDFLEENEMAGARNRQEFGEPLNGS
jgi:hypothetical protein